MVFPEARMRQTDWTATLSINHKELRGSEILSVGMFTKGGFSL